MKQKVSCYAFDKRGRLLSEAQNNYTKTHPIQKHFAKIAGQPYRQYLHAEIAALLKCGDKTPYSLRVVRRMSNGANGASKPCKVCQAAIKAYGVKYVDYYDENGCVQTMEF